MLSLKSYLWNAGLQPYLKLSGGALLGWFEDEREDTSEPDGSEFTRFDAGVVGGAFAGMEWRFLKGFLCCNYRMKNEIREMRLSQMLPSPWLGNATERLESANCKLVAIPFGLTEQISHHPMLFLRKGLTAKKCAIRGSHRFSLPYF